MVKQYSNFSAEQERQVLNSFCFEHKIKNLTIQRSFSLLNKAYHIYDGYQGNDKVFHYLYEVISEDGQNLWNILNLISDYGCLNFSQIRQYTISMDNVVFAHARDVKKQLDLLLRLDLIEQLTYSFTNSTDNKEIKTHAYILTQFGYNFIKHINKTKTTHFPSALGQINQFVPYMQCLQAFDLDNLLQQRPYFLNSFVQLISVNKRYSIVYHCYLLAPVTNEIYEMNVYFPAWYQITTDVDVIADNQKTKRQVLNSAKLNAYLNTNFNNTFIVDNSFNYQNDFNIKRFTILRLLTTINNSDIDIITKATKAYLNRNDNAQLGLLLANQCFNDNTSIDKSFIYIKNDDIANDKQNLYFIDLTSKENMEVD